MSTRIRLRRMGSNKRPFYRVVVADQRSARDGRFIEIIGKYHPLSDPSVIEIDEGRALHWLMVGAQPSNQVRNLMSKVGIWEKFVAERPGAAIKKQEKGDRLERPKISKKAQAKAAEAAKAANAEQPAAEPAAQGVTPGAKATEAAPETIAPSEAPDPQHEPAAPEPEPAAASEPGAEEPSEG
jgi:small subunit ribosomal protein S16